MLSRRRADCVLSSMTEHSSARCYRLAVIKTPQSMIARKAQKMIDAIFFWQDGHCQQAFVSEIERKQLPSVYAQYMTTVKECQLPRC